MIDDNPRPRCVICPRDLFDDEAGRYVCRICEQRISRDLTALAGPGGLYARLCLRIHPGRSGDGGAVSGTPGRSMPLNAEVLSLTAGGGIVSTLETWVEDWATYGLGTVGIGGRLQYRLDRAVATLHLNLGRACSAHPALDEFAAEVGQAIRRCEALITGERQPRKVPVQCPCGGILWVALDTPGEECRGCGTEYGPVDVKRLPIAERAAA
ncbi:hypothetical protein OG897_13420 [Streptomyces sp. NBC_00237]|uniref:hypothetical protein n=1 Tax=Streptomyces sp. NBC_00237 TaxID=2975687 RepID=UPI00224FEABD|nr:hypothetical protein [Streptomyces sp. NBC_00237]MCX5202443.1 hypothetical protein [Streptomyces sp. NBC_00237]